MCPRQWIETLLFGPMNVTRATLPVMRKQRSGLLVAISSTGGIAGQMRCRHSRPKANMLIAQAHAHPELSVSLSL